MSGPLIVPDASVLAKWVLFDQINEQDIEAAVLIQSRFLSGEIRLLVPSLWIFELGNLLAGKYPAKAKPKLEALAELEIPEARVSPAWLQKTVDLAAKYHVSFYDASYHALALAYDGVFVTADDKYISRAGKAGRVIPLREYD